MYDARTLALVGILLLSAVSAGWVFPAAAGAAEQTHWVGIDSCTVIEEPGTYVLTADIENSTEETCIDIRADDVVFDGNGHTIDGVQNESARAGILDAFFRGELGSRTDYAVVAGESAPRSNVTVQNLHVREWSWAIILFDVRGGTVRNSSVTDTGFGITLDSTADVSIVDSNASSNEAWGIRVYESRGGSIARTTTSDNGFAGVYLSGSRGVQVDGLVAERNGDSGLTMDLGAQNNRVTNSRLSDNELAGLNLYTAYDNVIVDSTAMGNGLYGLVLERSGGNRLENLSVRLNGIDGIYEDEAGANRIERVDDGTIPISSAGDDVIGEEGGYRYHESIDVNQSDGLTTEELGALVFRTIARVEYLRQLEFTEDIRVEVISREEFRERLADYPDETETDSAWINQIYEALFIVDEPTDAVAELEADEGIGTGAYYSPSRDKIVMISDEPRRPVVDPIILAHELTHALQDQHFDVFTVEVGTEDALLAQNGLVEGDATYVMDRFKRRCGLVWECVEDPTPGRSRTGIERNEGIDQMGDQPYLSGPVYIHRLLQEGGWERVNEQYARPPESTEQIIHLNRSDERPAPLSFEDTAENGWRPFDAEGVGGAGRGIAVGPDDDIRANTMGESSIYVMFWYQAAEYGIPVLDTYFSPDDEDDRHTYVSTPSEGWGNDLLVPYQKDGEYGYVWTTRWDTERDAREFHDAYLMTLRGHNAMQVGERTWVILGGGFADAFRVVREGRTVTIVNAPTVADLGDVRPGLADGMGGNVTGAAISPQWTPAERVGDAARVRPSTVSDPKPLRRRSR